MGFPLPICIDGEEMSEDVLRVRFTPEMLTTILKGRGLPHDGEKGELLAKRLMQHNREIYCKYMDALENSHQPSVLRFELFRRLPLEIREYIWELCHEPRILCVSRTSDRLEFLGYKNPPNPVTLSVCQESRAVALRNHRLMPCHEGTGLVYANFSGGDILYFNERYRKTINMIRDHRIRSQLYSSSSSISKDNAAAWFDLVERIIIDLDRRFRTQRRPPSIDRIKSCIRTFPKLRQLLVEKSPSCTYTWSEPSTIQQRQIEPSEDDAYQRDVRDRIAKAFAEAVEENAPSTRKPLKFSTVSIAVVPKAPTRDWMVDLSTPIAK